MKDAIQSDKLLQQHISDVSREGVWAGEDVIASAAHYLVREIHAYMVADKISPLIYSLPSQISCKSPLRIAYFEPGHYIYKGQLA